MNNKLVLISSLFILLIFIQSATYSQASTPTCTSVVGCLKVLNSSLISTSIIEKPPIAPIETPPIVPVVTPPTTKDYETLVAEEIHRLINIQRNTYGFVNLNWNDSLANAAKLHSQDMAVRNYFSHTSADGRTLEQRIDAQGIICSSWAENIFQNNYYSVESVASTTVNGWMSSPGHRANILTRYHDEGIGVAVATNGKVYITQDFC